MKLTYCYLGLKKSTMPTTCWYIDSGLVVSSSSRELVQWLEAWFQTRRSQVQLPAAERNKKNAHKIQDMNKSPCSSAAERLQHRRSPNLTAKVRKTDGYRLISGRSQDRNLSGAWIQETLQKGVKATETDKLEPNQCTRIAQRESAVKTSSVTSLDLHKVRTTDGYRLISRRSPDRNWLWVSLHFGRFAEASRHSLSDAKQQHMTGVARRFTLWAHNPEVTRSKRVSGILTLRPFTEAGNSLLSSWRHENQQSDASNVDWVSQTHVHSPLYRSGQGGTPSNHLHPQRRGSGNYVPWGQAGP